MDARGRLLILLSYSGGLALECLEQLTQAVPALLKLDKVVSAAGSVESLFLGGGIVQKEQFIEAVFRTARTRGLQVRLNRRGIESICFNEKSKKCLTRDHIGLLFELGIHRPDNVTADFRRLIDEVAPGRPCTHRGMREIVQRIIGAK